MDQAVATVSDLCAPQMTSYKCIDRNPGCCTVPWEETCDAPAQIRRSGSFIEPTMHYTTAQFLVLHQTCERGHYMSISNAIEFLRGGIQNALGFFDETTNSETNTSCVQCPAGRYNNISGSDSIDDCLECPAGTYGNTTGNTGCTNCTNGMTVTSSSPVGATTEDVACMTCAAGTFLQPQATSTIPDTVVCSVCAKDSFSTRDSPCLSCGENSYTLHDGSESVHACLCPPTFIRNEHNTDCYQLEPIQCEHMQIQDTPWSHCTWCLPFEINNTDNTACIPLDRDTLTSFPTELCGIQEVTSTLYNQDADAYYVACVECPLLNESDPTSRTYAGRDAIVSRVQCSMGCRPGTYTLYENVTLGYQVDGNYTCPSCTTGSVTLTFKEIDCSPCPAGTWAQDLTEAMRCQPVPAGYYQDEPGQTEYIACGPGTSSLEGSSVCT